MLGRENTEGEYAGLEHEVVPDVVESLKIITEVRHSLPFLHLSVAGHPCKTSAGSMSTKSEDVYNVQHRKSHGEQWSMPLAMLT